MLGFLLLAASTVSPAPAGAVEVVVFCDANRNGRLDPDEAIRVPDAVVEIGGRTARTEAGSGRAVIANVEAGSHAIVVRAESLPPFYAPGGPMPIRVPAPGPIAVPVTLDAGGNRPELYLAMGDSITDGDGSSDGAGYRSRLQARLCAFFGEAAIVNVAATGTDSHRGARIIDDALAVRPAYTLILYGTNDWDEEAAAFTTTLNSLRRMVRKTRAARSLPFLATVIPTNVGADLRASPARNRWVAALDRNIRRIAVEEGAVLVDLETAFLAQPRLAALYRDGLHPNDAGYDVITATFFAAITRRAIQR